MSNNGKVGEKLFKQLMENRKHTVVDVSGNPDYWSKDIDFILTSPTGERTTVEVKWDDVINRTGNLYLEITNVNSKQWNGEGWYKHCEAEYLAYGNARANLFYIIPFQQLKDRVQQLPRKTGRCDDDSVGLLVHLTQIRDLITEMRV